MRLNFGSFNGENALGMSVLGILDRNLLGYGETIAVGGGLGIGLSDGSVGGRVGVQLSWK
jgi:hypothetical protein